MTPPDIPEGFERQTRPSPLTDPWEPIYSRQTADAIILGLRLGRPHTNGRGFAHGGLIAALADKAMGHSCGHKMRGAYSLVTVSMSVDFIGSGQIGQWLAVETDVIKTGSTICFAQSLITADDAVIARANATFRVVPKAA
ncbi:MAG TPA: PaaI family thioesterase [Bradyrhizobium sp.]|nr:PaaI family thioesterase [Bradyrhizobium sp.]